MVRRIPGWLRWRLLWLSNRLRLWRFSAWLVIDRRPLTQEQIEHGQKLWTEIQRRKAGDA